MSFLRPAPTYSRPSIHIISDIYDIYQVMDGPINLRRLAALMRSCVKQATPARYFDGGGIGGSSATVVQMVVHSTCRAPS